MSSLKQHFSCFGRNEEIANYWTLLKRGWYIISLWAPWFKLLFSQFEKKVPKVWLSSSLQKKGTYFKSKIQAKYNDATYMWKIKATKLSIAPTMPVVLHWVLPQSSFSGSIHQTEHSNMQSMHHKHRMLIKKSCWRFFLKPHFSVSSCFRK